MYLKQKQPTDHRFRLKEQYHLIFGDIYLPIITQLLVLLQNYILQNYIVNQSWSVDIRICSAGSINKFSSRTKLVIVIAFMNCFVKENKLKIKGSITFDEFNVTENRIIFFSRKFHPFRNFVCESLPVFHSGKNGVCRLT